LAQADFLAGARSDKLYDTLDVIDQIAAETGKTVSQVALRWVLQRPSVVSVVVGARNEVQLKENLGAVGWSLDAAQMRRLDEASEVRPIYPYWHPRTFSAINPPPVPVFADEK
jgi:aryl-alcohol dehydrogenase-like predicted oxidoreductase